MRPQLRIVTVLTLISVIAGGLLTLFALYTGPRIEENARRALQAAISDVLPGIESYREVKNSENFRIYEGKNAAGRCIGYAIYSADSGFQDKIALIFSVSPDLARIHSLAVLEQKETPGLGAKIADEQFFLQFWREKSLRQPVTFAKPPKARKDLGDSEINAISGATISSKAVVGIVNRAIVEARQCLGVKP
jgi:Na+-translocating ferredoxin:NAD+ oxidoreductase subunit G